MPLFFYKTLIISHAVAAATAAAATAAAATAAADNATRLSGLWCSYAAYL